HTAEPERREACNDEDDRRAGDEYALVASGQELPKRRPFDLRGGLGRGLWRCVGFRHRNGRGAHQVLRAWAMETMAGPRMTTNSAGKIMKTSGKSILIGAFCACCSTCARRRFRISMARLRRICPTETPSNCP